MAWNFKWRIATEGFTQGHILTKSFSISETVQDSDIVTTGN